MNDFRYSCEQLRHRGLRLIFQQNKTLLYKNILFIAKINELKYNLLPHLSYSLDLTASDFYRYLWIKM